MNDRKMKKQKQKQIKLPEKKKFVQFIYILVV